MKSKTLSALYLALAILVGSDAFALTISKVSYSADKETVTYTNKTTAVFSATATQVTWGTDHTTKTTTYTFADKTTNKVIVTVAPVVGTPTYSAGVETIVTKYGDGTVKSTATNNATSAPVTWGTDHTTKTTTYTFADGTKNPVVESPRVLWRPVGLS